MQNVKSMKYEVKMREGRSCDINHLSPLSAPPKMSFFTRRTDCQLSIFREKFRSNINIGWLTDITQSLPSEKGALYVLVPKFEYNFCFCSQACYGGWAWQSIWNLSPDYYKWVMMRIVTMTCWLNKSNSGGGVWMWNNVQNQGSGLIIQSGPFGFQLFTFNPHNGSYLLWKSLYVCTVQEFRTSSSHPSSSSSSS